MLPVSLDVRRHVMRSRVILVLTQSAAAFLLSFPLSAQTSDALVREFALEARRLIAESDVPGFVMLPCLPEPCTDSDLVLERIFGQDDVVSNFERIMRQKNLDILINGPYTRESRWPSSTFNVIYFDPENAPFDSNGYIHKETGQAELYESFLQTEVTISDGVVWFHRMPFHVGAHHPHVEDYG